MMLAIMNMTRRLGRRGDHEYPGVALPASERWRYYGISGETYEAIHELAEFGLVQIHDPMLNRRHGRLKQLRRSLDDETSLAPVPYRFTCDVSGFNKDAYAVVSASLSAQLPPRLQP
jgi:hypothetical protein